MPKVEGIITQNVRDTIAPGLAVYDNASSRLGTTSDVNRRTGYMTVEMPPFSDKERPLDPTNLYVPFRLITTIDPQEVYLSMTKNELQKQYADPPARTVAVEGMDGSETAVTSEPSGYDGLPMVVERVPVGKLRKRITTGYHVYTSDHIDIGTIKQYDALTGWMLVEVPLPTDEPDLVVPLAVAADVDDVTREVHLVTSQADLQRMQHLEPANVVFVGG